MVFAEFASASVSLITNTSHTMANKQLIAMQSILFSLSMFTAYKLSFYDRKCGTQMLRYVIYFISRPTEIALLLG